MSQVIPLDPIPNQSLSILLDGHRYVITIRDIGAMMAVTIERDSVTIIDGVRAVGGFPLLPYEYLSDGTGNFIFTNTDEGAIPRFEDFGTKCQLVYSTSAEIADAAASA